ncbi:DUF742 domain-containing protein [Micromonospora pattaloongensis]
MTRGRTAPSRGAFDLITLVIARRPPAPEQAATLSPEEAELLARCAGPCSVAELAAELDLPAGTVRVLLGDLLEAGLIEAHQPPTPADAVPDGLLRAVLVGLRAL